SARQPAVALQAGLPGVTPETTVLRERRIAFDLKRPGFRSNALRRFQFRRGGAAYRASPGHEALQGEFERSQTTGSRLHFVDNIEGRFRCAAEGCEARLLGNVSKASFARLGAKCQPDFLGERGQRADHG